MLYLFMHLKEAYYDHHEPWGEIHPIESEIELIKMYGSKVIAIALNTEHCTPEEAAAFQKTYEEKTGLTVVLPLYEGCGRVVPLSSAIKPVTMNIKSVRSYKKQLALKRPYTIARNTFSAVEIVFFEVELKNGIIGIGASSTDEDVVGENADHTVSNLGSDIVQQLSGKDIRHFLSHISFYRQHFSEFPGTQAAIDIALARCLL